MNNFYLAVLRELSDKGIKVAHINEKTGPEIMAIKLARHHMIKKQLLETIKGYKQLKR